MLYQLRQMLSFLAFSLGFGKASAFFAGVLMSAIVAGVISVGNAFEIDKLTIKSGNGDHKFVVEVADEPAEQARGLMFRKELAKDHGMLFIYTDDKVRSMWMRNTYISLDMLFIDKDGKIFHIVRDTEPFSEENISSNTPGRAVLELVAGTVDRLDIRVGDQVKYKAFSR